MDLPITAGSPAVDDGFRLSSARCLVAGVSQVPRRLAPIAYALRYVNS